MNTIGVNDQLRQDLSGNWSWSLEEGGSGGASINFCAAFHIPAVTANVARVGLHIVRLHHP